MNLGIELRRLRKLHQLTLVKVHAKTGISVGFLSDMERGRTNPSLTTLKKLADLYQTWPSDVLRTAEGRDDQYLSNEALARLRDGRPLNTTS